MSFIAATPAVSRPKVVDRGVLTLRLIRCLAPLALGLMMLRSRRQRAPSTLSASAVTRLRSTHRGARSSAQRRRPHPVSTAPGTDGIVRRIEVRAREGGQNWWCSRSPTTPTTNSTA